MKYLSKFQIIIVLCMLFEFQYIAFFIWKSKQGINNPKIEIYSVFHKDYPIHQNEVVIPIHAGRALHHDYGKPLLNKMIGDDTGDNISLKNDRYAELTALYWIWKNSKADYVGLMHYRRNFCMEIEEIEKQCVNTKIECICSLACDCGLTYDNVLKLMEKYDIVTTVTLNLKDTLREHYRYAHHIEDLELAEDYIKEHYPEMAETFYEVIDGHEFNARNMFIMSRKLMTQYAEWLFDILFHIEPKISHDDGYQRLAAAYLGERLLSVWVRYQVKINHLKMKGLYVHTLKKA